MVYVSFLCYASYPFPYLLWKFRSVTSLLLVFLVGYGYLLFTSPFDLNCSALHSTLITRVSSLLWLLLTSCDSLLLWFPTHKTSRDKLASLSSSTCLIYLHGLRLPFGLRDFRPTYPPCRPWYQVPVRQATISLSLLLAHTSRYEPWESLSGSSATTPFMDFHHRLTACPSYLKSGASSLRSLRRFLAISI